MTTYLFPPPSVASLPVRGRTERFPVERLFFVGRNDHAHAIEIVPMQGVILEHGEIALRIGAPA